MEFHPGAPDSGPPDDGGPRPDREGDRGSAGAPIEDYDFSFAELDMAVGPAGTDPAGGPMDIGAGPMDTGAGPMDTGSGPFDTAGGPGGPADIGGPVWEPGDEDGPYFAWLPPEDRLWRHPSERLAVGAAASSFQPTDSGGRSERVLSLPGSGWGRTWTVAIVAGLVGALSVSALAMGAGWWSHQTTVVRSILPSSPSVSLAAAGNAPTNWTAIDDSVAASVVSITVTGASGPRQGSGVVLVDDGEGRVFVITDRTIFAPSASEGDQGGIEVTFLSGAVARGTLVGQDALSGVAVVEVPNAGRVIPASIGSVAELHAADPVLAVGSRMASAVATGAVSGEDQVVDLSDGSDMDGLISVTMPALAPAADGGPLLDQYGRVVGMTVGIQPVDSGQGPVTYAVPIDQATRVASQIIDGHRPTHAWLGVDNSADVPSVMAHQMGLSGGVQVGSVEEGSPADRAGLQAADIITGFDGRPLVSTGALIAQMAACQPGRSVALTFVHAGRTEHTAVHLGEESAGGS